MRNRLAVITLVFAAATGLAFPAAAATAPSPRSLFCDNNNDLLPSCSDSFITACKRAGGSFEWYDDKQSGECHGV